MKAPLIRWRHIWLRAQKQSKQENEEAKPKAKSNGSRLELTNGLIVTGPKRLQHRPNGMQPKRTNGVTFGVGDYFI
jgi:hypothetical protein